MTHEMMVADVVARVGRGEKPRRKWGNVTHDDGVRLWVDLWIDGAFFGRVWNGRDGSLDRFTASLGAWHAEVQIGGEPVVFSSIEVAQVFVEALAAAQPELDWVMRKPRSRFECVPIPGSGGIPGHAKTCAVYDEDGDKVGEVSSCLADLITGSRMENTVPVSEHAALRENAFKAHRLVLVGTVIQVVMGDCMSIEGCLDVAESLLTKGESMKGMAPVANIRTHWEAAMKRAEKPAPVTGG